MRIHKEGKRSIIISIITGVILIFIGQRVENIFITIGLYLLAIYIISIVVYFFRQPNRPYKTIAGEIYAPVDGKIVAIEKVHVQEFLNEERIQVSVFMSPTNVHINWSPISGVVTYFKYHPGKFLVAWHPKSSTLNERTTYVVKDEKGISILFRQIAGALARRIVHYKKEGDAICAGEEFGFIKFGSRVDVFLPIDAQIKVKINEKVEGRTSVIAQL